MTAEPNATRIVELRPPLAHVTQAVRSESETTEKLVVLGPKNPKRYQSCSKLFTCIDHRWKPRWRELRSMQDHCDCFGTSAIQV